MVGTTVHTNGKSTYIITQKTEFCPKAVFELHKLIYRELKKITLEEYESNGTKETKIYI